MSLIAKIKNSGFISLEKVLNLFPPFLFFGIKIRLSDNYRKISILIPAKWWALNNNGVIFGGLISSASDPFPSIVFEKIIPGVKAWNKSHFVKFIRPASSKIRAEILITDSQIEKIRESLDSTGKAEETFKYSFKDSDDKIIAKIETRTYLTY